MKRYLTALLAGAAVFAIVYGAAATLIVDAGTVQAGEDGGLKCDQDGIKVEAWAVNTYPVLEGVESVKITGVDDDCDGARIMGRVTLKDSDPGDNASYAYTSGDAPFGPAVYTPVIASGDETTVYTLYLKKSDLTTDWYVPAEEIVGLKVWLEGQASDTD